MEVTIDNIQYELDSSNNTAKVVCKESKYAGDVVIPSHIYCDGIKYVVDTIGDEAFEDCSSLVSITIPNSVTTIGGSAFWGCSSLISVVIPNGLKEIKEYTFFDCSSLASIVIPNNITSINERAFKDCSALNAIVIPNSITKIGIEAFSGCSSLTSIRVEVGNNVYDSREECNAIVETTTNTIVAGCQSTIIPDSVTKIGDFAFSGCKLLKTITIPNCVISIGKFAFKECSTLDSITIPHNITSIGGGAFENSGIYNNDSNWEEGVLYINNCLIATNENLCGIYTIQDNTRLIGDYAFRYCEALTEIIIPDSVTSIGKYAFTECSSLASIIIPNSVTNIDEGAFQECSSLCSIILPNGIKSIKCRTFSSCFALTSIILPNSISRIEDYAFYDCSSLTSITIPSGVTYIGKHAFGGCYFLTSINIPDSVTTIEEEAFAGCSSLKSIIIPNGLRTIGSKAFSECTSLTSIFMPNSIIYIGEKAFSKCSKLSSVTIPTSVTNLEKNVFYGCTSLNSITVEPGNTIYDSREDCNAIIETATNTLITGCQNTTIPNSVTTIEDYAFYCSPITSIAIPNSVTSIGEGAFWGCSALTSLTFPNGVTNIESGTLQKCTSLTSISIPTSVKNVAYTALLATSSLREICIPTGQMARFQQMDGLKKYEHLLKEHDSKEITDLIKLAKAHLSGIGVLQDIEQATQYYMQAAEKGSIEAAYILADWYANGTNLTKDINKALQYYQQATKAFYGTQSSTKKNKGKYLFFDTECNGLPKNYKLDVTAISNWPRLIQLAWIVTDEDGNELKRKSRIIYPIDFKINNVVADLTGITTQRALQEGVDLTIALSEFMEDITTVEIIVGHNINFDRHIVGCELYRTIGRHNTLMNKAYICTMQSSVDFCAIPSDNLYSNYKWPKLEELYRKLFGHMFDNAHDALADVSATKDCYFELKKKRIL